MKAIITIDANSAQPSAAKLRVAAYCRVSTGTDEQLVSLEAQKSHYEKLITSNPGWEFAGLYYDEGISGTSKEKRPALQKMIADCEAGNIDRIMTKSLSRFARNTADCLEMIRKLLNLGITIFFEKENLDTGSMESELLLSIMSSFAESESVSISKNNKWSVQHRFENGTFKLWSAPYGYSIEDGCLTINEDEARWVRWIYAQALNGHTGNAIATQLNSLKVPSRRGDHWAPTTIMSMLTNEKYIGACLFQKTFTDHRFKRHKNHGDRDQYFIEGHHAAIISKEDYEAVGALIKQRTREKGIKKQDPRYRNRYPFTKKLVCGVCGATLKHHIIYSGGLRYPVWICKQHLKDRDLCSMKSIRESDLEFAFTTMMNKLIFSRREVLHFLHYSLEEETYKNNPRRVEEIEQKLKKNAEQVKTLTTIMSNGHISPAFFKKESNELAAESEALAKEKERLIKTVTGDAQKTSDLNNLIRFVDKAYPTDCFDGTLVSEFLDHATVHSRTMISFKLKCGLSLLERM